MIKIESRIGSVALAIAGEIKNGRESFVLAKGLASEVYRAGASKVFGPKGHKRDEQFSPVLAADVESALKLVLAENFDSVEIQSKEYVKPEKITVESVLASLSDEALQAALDARKNGKSEEDIG